jgi:hypothetical protein
MTAESPENAARGDIPARYCRRLGASVAPDGRNAVVLLGTNEPPLLYPYLVNCHFEAGRWVEDHGSNGSGWSPTHKDAEGRWVGVLAEWEDAPHGAEAAILEYDGEETKVPVVDRYYFFAKWGVPEDELWWLGRNPKLPRVEYLIGGRRVPDPHEAQKRRFIEAARRGFDNAEVDEFLPEE